MNKSESARVNGSKSRGPTTPEGKARSSRNALKHGLTATFSVLSHESEKDFDSFFDAYLDRFRPADPVEAELVHTLAVSRWRLRRIASLESNLFNNELLLSQQSIPHEIPTTGDGARLAWLFNRLAAGSALPLLMRYESSLNRAHDRALKQLEHLQKLRNEPTAAAPLQSTPTSRASNGAGDPTKLSAAAGNPTTLPAPGQTNRASNGAGNTPNPRNDTVNSHLGSTPLQPPLTAPSPLESGTGTNAVRSSRFL